MSQVTLDDLKTSKVDRAPHAEWAKAEVVVGPDGGSLTTGVLEVPLELAADWAGVLRGFGLDPDIFEIVDDTVRMSKWQQSKRLENGDRDTIWLWSYSARFTRIPPRLEEIDVKAISKRLVQWKPLDRKKISMVDSLPSTYLVNIADVQIAKSQGGGVKATVERVMTALEESVRNRDRLTRSGRNIESTMVANMGDPIEGCEGQYSSQTFTVEINLRQQLKLAVELFIKAIDMHSADEYLSTLSNHSEWMRRGGKSITGDSDSADGHISEMLKLAYEMAGRGPTEWHIPHDEMQNMAVLSGVPVAFTHGHKIPSRAKESEWLKGQSIRLLREYGYEPRIWVTAHLHHLDVRDFGPWFRFQCPSLDGGSKFFTDGYGNGEWATAGLLTFLVGKHDTRSWSDMVVL